MLTLDKQFIHKGTQVYGDTDEPNAFYVIPPHPRFSFGDDGEPVFTFISYRGDPNREASKQLLGAMAFFDVEFYATPEEEANAREGAKQYYGITNAVLKRPTYLRGTTELILAKKADDKAITVANAGRPSLVGNNTSSFNMQFDAEWAQVFLSGMKDGRGIVQVAYRLGLAARFSETTVNISYSSDQIRDFLAVIERKKDDAGISKEVSEAFKTNRLGKIDIIFGDAVAIKDDTLREKARTSIRDWALKRLEEQMQKQIDDLAGVSAEERKRFEDLAAEEAKKGGWRHEQVSWFFHRYYWSSPEQRSTLKDKVVKNFNYAVTLREAYVIEHEIVPQATLPAIPTLINTVTKKPVVWKDQELDLVSKFFRRINFVVDVEHTFPQTSPITNVTVTVHYGDNFNETSVFKDKAHDPWTKLANYDAKSGENFTYEYQVRYAGGGTFDSGILKSNKPLVFIGDADLGVLHIDMDGSSLFGPGSDCVALEAVMSYPGAKQKTVRLTKEAPKIAFDFTVFAREPKPRSMKYTYQFKDGSTWTENVETSDLEIVLYHPFGQSLRRAIDLSELESFKTVELQFTYTDGDYTRTVSAKFTPETMAKAALVIPVRDRNRGQLAYTGSIEYEGGSKRRIERTIVASGADKIVVPEVGDRRTISVSVSDDFWNIVKSIKDLKLRYQKQKYSSTALLTKDTMKDGITWPIDEAEGAAEAFEYDADLLYIDKTKKAKQIRKQKVEGFDLVIEAE